MLSGSSAASLTRFTFHMMCYNPTPYLGVSGSFQPPENILSPWEDFLHTEILRNYSQGLGDHWQPRDGWGLMGITRQVHNPVHHPSQLHYSLSWCVRNPFFLLVTLFLFTLHPHVVIYVSSSCQGRSALISTLMLFAHLTSWIPDSLLSMWIPIHSPSIIWSPQKLQDTTIGSSATHKLKLKSHLTGNPESIGNPLGNSRCPLLSPGHNTIPLWPFIHFSLVVPPLVSISYFIFWKMSALSTLYLSGFLHYFPLFYLMFTYLLM